LTVLHFMSSKSGRKIRNQKRLQFEAEAARQFALERYDVLDTAEEDWTCNGLVPVACLSLCHLSFESQGAYAAQI
jgi:hypothetical protein